METESIQSRPPACISCKHWKKDWVCAAFPNGIPEEIRSGDNQHEKPLKKQGNKIVFEDELA